LEGTTHIASRNLEEVEPDESRSLSAKEEAVILLLATGSTRAQIAERLALAESTVGHLLTAAKEKLGARTLPHAVHIYTGQTLRRELRP
jgi:DNA-binding CsgD family transcriptional regulator